MMELVALVRELSRRRLLAVVVVLIAALAAVASSYKLPSMEKRSIAVGAATGQILIDSDPSTLVAGGGTDQIDALGSRARVYAQYLSSRSAVAEMSKETGIPSTLITARGPFSEGTGTKNYQQQPAESRATDLVDEGKQYRLVFQAQEDVPIITVYATGPTAPAALKLARSSFTTLESYVADLKRKVQEAKSQPKSPPVTAADGTTVSPLEGAEDVVVRELGEPEGGTVGGSADLTLMVMAFIAVLGLQILAFALITRFRQQSRLAREADAPNGPALVGFDDEAAVSERAGADGDRTEAEAADEARWRTTYVRG
jgi:hypothetical protein